jgi:predicted phosphohydrolase
MKIGFDVISDLYLSPEDSFNWENKATSLYCVIAGNISSDIRTIVQTLAHLSRFYQGIFYIPGHLEYEDTLDIQAKTSEIVKICNKIKNVAVLQNRIVIIDGVAILGCNGWYGNATSEDPDFENDLITEKYNDLMYLKNGIEKLQKHLDVKKIMIVTNSVPSKKFYFGEEPESAVDEISPNMVLAVDVESKITHWAFGTYKKVVDTTINSINYVNNPYLKLNPYWAKRIDIEV